MIDAEKENLAKSRDTLMKEVSELRYEKGELHQRIESLQFVCVINCLVTFFLSLRHLKHLLMNLLANGKLSSYHGVSSCIYFEADAGEA